MKVLRAQSGVFGGKAPLTICPLLYLLSKVMGTVRTFLEVGGLRAGLSNRR